MYLTVPKIGTGGAETQGAKNSRSTQAHNSSHYYEYLNVRLWLAWSSSFLHCLTFGIHPAKVSVESGRGLMTSLHAELDQCESMVIETPSRPSIRLLRYVIILDVEYTETRTAITWIRWQLNHVCISTAPDKSNNQTQKAQTIHSVIHACIHGQLAFSSHIGQRNTDDVAVL